MGGMTMVMTQVVGAGDIGGKLRHFVHQSLSDQEIERPIDGRRGSAALLAAQTLQKIIGARGKVAVDHQSQH